MTNHRNIPKWIMFITSVTGTPGVMDLSIMWPSGGWGHFQPKWVKLSQFSRILHGSPFHRAMNNPNDPTKSQEACHAGPRNQNRLQHCEASHWGRLGSCGWFCLGGSKFNQKTPNYLDGLLKSICRILQKTKPMLYNKPAVLLLLFIVFYIAPFNTCLCFA